MNLHQALQSILQFVIALVTQLINMAVQNGGQPPTTVGELYLPVLLAIAAALGIWTVSKIQLADNIKGT